MVQLVTAYGNSEMLLKRPHLRAAVINANKDWSTLCIHDLILLTGRKSPLKPVAKLLR